MVIVPVQAVPNQSVTAYLNGQQVTLNIYSRLYGLFMDVLVAGTAIVYGTLCLDRNTIIRSQYLGFSGELMWIDSQGTSDPVYSGLGSRFALAYLAPSDLPAGAY